MELSVFCSTQATCNAASLSCFKPKTNRQPHSRTNKEEVFFSKYGIYPAELTCLISKLFLAGSKDNALEEDKETKHQTRCYTLPVRFTQPRSYNNIADCF